MSTLLVPDRPLSPPDVAWGERDRRYHDAYAEVLGQVLAGRGEFWPSNDWRTATDAPALDNEQYIPVFAAVRRALACADITDAQRWAIVKYAVAQEADAYAQRVAQERSL